jgi:hypothetical protein
LSAMSRAVAAATCNVPLREGVYSDVTLGLNAAESDVGTEFRHADGSLAYLMNLFDEPDHRGLHTDLQSMESLQALV